MSDELRPEEYVDVLVYDADGKPIIAHRNGSRWYGYTLLTWLDFVPTRFTPLTRIEAAEARCKSALNLYGEYHDTNIELRADLARKDAEIKALDELVEALEAEKNIIETYGDLHCELNQDQPECKKMLTKVINARRRTTQTRAKLAAVRGEK